MKTKIKFPLTWLNHSSSFLFDAIRPIPDAENLDFDVGQSLIVKSKLFGDRLGHVEHATPDERPTVIATHNCGTSIGQIGNPNFARQGKCFVGGRAGPRPEVLAGRCLSRKNKPTFIIVGGQARLAVAHGLSRRNRVIAPATDRIGLRFVAFHMRPYAARKRKAHEQENGNGYAFFHDGISVFKRFMAALRDAGMLPQ